MEENPDLTVLDRTTQLLRPHFPGAIAKVPLPASSIVTAILNYAQECDSDAIVLGASRAGILERVVNGNIPAAISKKSDRTVIIVRGT